MDRAVATRPTAQGHQDRHAVHLQTHLLEATLRKDRDKGQLGGEYYLFKAVIVITQYRQRKSFIVQERQDTRQRLGEDGEKVPGRAGV